MYRGPGNRMQFSGRPYEFVDELPREELPELKAALERRLCREALALAKAATAAAAPRAPLCLVSTKEAADYFDCSADTIRELVRAGALAAQRHRVGGRLHFDLADLDDYKTRHRTVAHEVDRRYSVKYDFPRRQDTAPSAPPDPARPRRRTRRDADNGGPVGAGRPGRDTARRGRPYAPGKAAWSDPSTDEES